jgi:hypothetical protein
MNYMPKDGWVEILQDICPLCGNPLPEPSDLDIQWLFIEPFCLFTGAYARAVCCGQSVFLTWRKSDGLFHYEIKADRYWRCKSDDRHRLNEQLEQLRARAIDNDSRNVLQSGEEVCERGLFEPVPDMATAGNEVLPQARGLSKQYDF